MAKTKAQDLYMQFAGAAVTLASGAAALHETVFDTFLSPRGGFAWLCHKFEWLMEGNFIQTVNAVLSTRRGGAAMPTLIDDGTVDVFQSRAYIVGIPADEFEMVRQPIVHNFLPPIPLARGRLSLYGQAAADPGVPVPIYLRIGYTTVELDAKTYDEINETWAWIS